jgi:D-alanyl-D-alanine carboxypeptidase (penicillin-binding protein 5/6)
MIINSFFAKSIKHIITLVITLLTSTTFANTKPMLNPITIPSAPTLNSKAYLLIDHNSDKILAEKNIHEKVEPASLTKMMTMYVIDHELKNNNLHMNDEILISKNAWHAQGSRMFLEVGKKVPVEELIKGIIIQSGNDASIALAEHIAGSEVAFADLMNGYAKMLGMNNTNFINATGLPDENHYTTAYDMALLTKAIIKDFPETYNIYSQKSFTFNGIEQFNRNRLLWRNNAVDGVKTGHTDSAGFCLVASGKRADMRLTAIILGASSDDLRINDANKLLIWGFRFFETHLVHNATQALQNVRVWMGKTKQLELGLLQDLYITIPHGQFNKLDISMSIPKIIRAPMEKGAQVGTYKITLQDQTIIEQPIIALDDIKTGGFWSNLKDSAILNMQSLWEKVKI